MNDSPKLPINQPTNPNSVQDYHVPTARMDDPNQPSRWSWVGVNCTAFGVSCILYPMFNVGGFCMFARSNFRIGSINDHSSGILISIFIFAIPVFITIYIASRIQCGAINEHFRHSVWSFNSALIGTFTFISISYLIIANNSELTSAHFIGIVFFVFGFTSSAISWVQWRELRHVVDNAWQWVLITIITWTGLGTLILGAGISYGLQALIRR
ncbi:MAG: hypothetical protein LCH85_06335 [Chloroflexi bacterium]|nr:hypothetical protein [Chloroflexota bacterium]